MRVLSRADEIYPRYNAHEMTDAALAWLTKERRSENPMFMYLHYSDPHAPYHPPEHHDRWREFAPEAGQRIKAPLASPPTNGKALGADEYASLVARYDAEIAYFDEEFGRLVDGLRTLGLYDNSLIVLTADHGEEFYDHSGWAHAHSLFDELLRVPLIVRWPRAPGESRGRSTCLVGLIDIVPTVADALGATWEGNFRGANLRPPGQGQCSTDRALYADNETPRLRAVVQGDRKMIQTLSAGGSVMREEHFVLSIDPREQANGLEVPLPDALMLRRMRSFASIASQPVGAAERIKVDSETMDELKALGYIK